ncbi:folylpolyglutamate synthase [Pyricularia oryzae]|nr:folylpolyglutamate synthase [Pyricularia oryzae]KAI7929523.1 folylpolyglutamate synthase [Pyricularia oryzae]
MLVARASIRPNAQLRWTLTANIRSRTFSSRVSRGQSYSSQDAIDLLNTLQTPFKVFQARVAAGVRPDASFMTEMRSCLARIGHSPRDLDRLNIVHVAGTKGKGTVCAYVDSILNRWRASHGVPGKLGLLTSPHLISVRERIRINSEPVSEDLFAKYFFEVWDRLEQNPPQGSVEGVSNDGSGRKDDWLDHWSGGSYAGKPIYARYLTLMSWHLFLSEGVDLAVYETGIGGEYDATNVVERPLATAITTLGIDHVHALGGTIGEIAWHKAGIIKSGSMNYTVRHETFPEAEDVLKERAAEKGAELELLEIDPRLDTVKINPDKEFQRKNATLGVALAEAALSKLDPSFTVKKSLPQEFVEGLEKVVWRGRCEVKDEDDVRWHIDGAHTLDSLKVAGGWFADEVKTKYVPWMIIYGCKAAPRQQNSYRTFVPQPGHQTAKGLTWWSFAQIEHMLSRASSEFVNLTVDAAEVDSLKVQHAFAKKWLELDPNAGEVKIVASIEEAIQAVRQLAAGKAPSAAGKGNHQPDQVQALVTGSIHLIGGALEILEGDAKTL